MTFQDLGIRDILQEPKIIATVYINKSNVRRYYYAIPLFYVGACKKEQKLVSFDDQRLKHLPVPVEEDFVSHKSSRSKISNS
jgi:hypothetical protein